MVNESLELAHEQEIADYSSASPFFWLDILVFCAILATLVSCF